MKVHSFNEGGKFTQIIEVGEHRLFADQPAQAGGNDKGPEPHDYLLVALASCTAMTVKMYSDRKQWPLKKVDVDVTLIKGEDKINTFNRVMKLEGDLDQTQRERLLEIANKCPVHLILSNASKITTQLL
jgi:putative redox protein